MAAAGIEIEMTAMPSSAPSTVGRFYLPLVEGTAAMHTMEMDPACFYTPRDPASRVLSPLVDTAIHTDCDVSWRTATDTTMGAARSETDTTNDTTPTDTTTTTRSPQFDNAEAGGGYRRAVEDAGESNAGGGRGCGCLTIGTLLQAVLLTGMLACIVWLQLRVEKLEQRAAERETMQAAVCNASCQVEEVDVAPCVGQLFQASQHFGAFFSCQIRSAFRVLGL